MTIRKIRVQIETERLRISGTLQLPTEGYRSRVTDYLNGHDTGFFALTDAEIAPIDGSPADLGVMEDESSGPSLADYSSPSAPPPPPS